MHADKPVAGASLPELTFELVRGGRISVGGVRDCWMLLIVYRGAHCGRCKAYLNRLQAMAKDWTNAGFEVLALSADPIEKAKSDVQEHGWEFDVAFGLDLPQMRKLGLYISAPLSPGETDRIFAEPGVFCVRPDGTIQIAAISNGPAARPDLAELLDGMIFTITHDRPARGTFAG